MRAMATITASSSLSLPIFLSTSKPYNLPSLRSSSPPNLSRRPTSLPLNPLPPTGISLRRRLHAVPEQTLATESDALVEQSQEIVSTGADGDGVSTVISALLFVAFLGLSILTIGVIYIAVTDFLQKREKEKFEKEEAAASKKSGKKKVKVKPRSGPRGFGQKIEEDELD